MFSLTLGYPQTRVGTTYISLINKYTIDIYSFILFWNVISIKIPGNTISNGKFCFLGLEDFN